MTAHARPGKKVVRPRLGTMPTSRSAETMLEMFVGGSHISKISTLARQLVEETPDTPHAVHCIASLGAWGKQDSHCERDAHAWLSDLAVSLHKYDLLSSLTFDSQIRFTWKGFYSSSSKLVFNIRVLVHVSATQIQVYSICYKCIACDKVFLSM